MKTVGNRSRPGTNVTQAKHTHAAAAYSKQWKEGKMLETKINLNEMFVSIDGEVNRYGQGGLTTFIRFAGCNLNCPYCDTPDAKSPVSGKLTPINQILNMVETTKVTITGGEPLAQKKECVQLINTLCQHGIAVTIETNGSIKIPFKEVAFNNSLIGWVIDYKIHCQDKMVRDNFDWAGKNDWIKIVIDSEDDYHIAEGLAQWFHGNTDARLAFGFTSKIEPVWLLGNMVKDRLWFVSLNCQIHKFLHLK